MAWSWTDINTLFNLVLDDADGSTFTTALRVDAINYALRSFVIHAPREKTAAITLSTLAVPSDCYRLIKVRVSDDGETWYSLPRTYVTNEDQLSVTSTVDDSTYPDAWYVWNDTIYLGRTHDSMSLLYEGYYTEVTTAATDVPVPIWAREAIVYRAMAYCLNPFLVTRSRLGAWNVKQDAPPLDNPLIQAAKFYREEYNRIVQEHKLSGQGRY